MNFRGVIIEESLEDKNILKHVKILKTKIEKVTEKHKTPWLKQWTLHTVEIPEKEADFIAQKISHSIDLDHSSWYADFKNDKLHYIIFRERVFVIDRKRKDEYANVKAYGISIGIPEYQLDFSETD